MQICVCIIQFFCIINSNKIFTFLLLHLSNYSPSLKCYRMKFLLFPLLSSICFAPVSQQINVVEKQTKINSHTCLAENKNETPAIVFQDGVGAARMSAVAFKNQDYCRAELENFEFDVRFTIVSATVYFSGANFKNVEKGFLTSNSLKTIKHLMVRSIPGTNVVFDEIKVKGPGDTISMIDGKSLLLY